MNRTLFNLVWILSLFMRLLDPNRFTIALNETFFWVGLTWILYDILMWGVGKYRNRKGKTR